jgi:hypothetical protein
MFEQLYLPLLEGRTLSEVIQRQTDTPVVHAMETNA